MIGALVAPPSENVAPTSSVAWTAGTADPDYPVANVTTLEPDVVAKTTAAGAATLTATIAATALEGVAIINTNARGLTATLSNSGGMTPRPLVIPSPEDGLCCNAYWDLAGIAGTTAASWSIAIAAAPGPVAIGTLLLIRTWTRLRVRWDWDIGDVFPVIEHRTGYGKRLQYQIPVRTRKYNATALDAAQRNLLRQIAREAHGSIVPWALVPDYEDDAVLLVQWVPTDHPETHRIGRGRFDTGTAVGVVDRRLALEEVNAGIAL